MSLLGRLRRDEDGAVTVDWVVLTAAVATLGILVVNGIWSAATETAGEVGAILESRPLGVP